MENYQQYAIKDNNWWKCYVDKMTFEQFEKYLSRVYSTLNKLLPGKFYDIIKINPKQLDLFIKCCCDYIDCHPDYYMSEDYTRIYKNEDYEQRKMVS